MRKFAETAEAIAATTKKLQKIALVAEYLKSRTIDEAAVSAIFLSGRPFPAWEETTLQFGGRLLWRVVAELSGQSESALTASYRKHGDLGSVAGEILPERPGQGSRILEVAATFRQIAATRGPAAKAALVRDLLARATPLEAKYIVKIMTGDLRIGLKESLVEEAIAKAYAGTRAGELAGAMKDGVMKDAALKEVQRANMLLGDIGETVRLAAQSKLAEAKMRIFHPLGFMLASPIESAEEGLSYFAEAAVEDKYDGIRAQAHVSDGEVKFFSRTRDEITESFPELPAALAGLPQNAILDGEIVAWSYSERESVGPALLPATAAPAAGLRRDHKAEETEKARPAQAETQSPSPSEQAGHAGQARPFSILQQRLGRKKVSEKMLREIPVAYLVFDVLYAGGELLIHRPLCERARILDQLLIAKRKSESHGDTETRRKATQGTLAFAAEDPVNGAQAAVIRAPAFRAATPEDLEALFAAAQARGNEGLMIKDLSSPYTPGKRGKSWLKMKRELATLDVVVTAVEYGHGKRVGVLSDYTFAVWDRDQGKLVNIGKAYSGLTDAEIAEMTQWFLEHTIEDQGFRRVVEPKVVLEVAFNNMMQSERHESGYALRFPRIVRLRPDKSPEEADTIERAREIYEKQRQ
ncbi:MAG: ATP-dependent DNA ligase [Candidatus Sulfotelmatobacter sp.]